MVETVTIQPVTPNPSLEQQAASQEAAAAEAAKESAAAATLAGEETTPAERPSWLPEKFKTPEDMAKAYASLETAQSQSKSEDAAVDEAVSKAGLDMSTLADQYEADGKLSEDNMKALEAAGITEGMVDDYIAGVNAKQAAETTEMLSGIEGSVERYDTLTGWAADNLDNAAIDEFNSVLETGNTAAIKLAIADLNTRYVEAEGSEPAVHLDGNSASTEGGTYGDTADLMKDMQNPMYAQSEAFRAKVAAKLARSAIL